jgi:AraC-like DNA-binding protein
MFEQNGTSFRAFVNEARMRQATRLLADPSIPIDEIALSLGYKRNGNFSRAFRNVSPQSLRDVSQEQSGVK